MTEYKDLPDWVNWNLGVERIYEHVNQLIRWTLDAKLDDTPLIAELIDVVRRQQACIMELKFVLDECSGKRLSPTEPAALTIMRHLDTAGKKQ